MVPMKYLPNILSSLRMVGAVALLLSNVSSSSFWVLYIVCGISDIADGWLARKLKCVTRSGAVLDSLADICFVACCAWKLLPILELPQWLWLWAGVIVAMKVVNQLLSLAKYKRFCFPHTLANKATGFLLFITVPTIVWSIIPISITAIVATFAAIQEGHGIVALTSPRPRFTFNTVGLFTTDNSKMVAFYRDVFGFQTEWNGKEPNVELHLAGSRIILFPRTDFEQMTSQQYAYPRGVNGTMELSFDVPTFADVDKEYATALGKGVKAIFPPTTEPWGQRTCYVADPEGNLIEIASFVESNVPN